MAISLLSYSDDSIDFNKIAIGESGNCVFAQVIQVLSDKSLLVKAPAVVGVWTIKINNILTKDIVDNQTLNKMKLKRTGTYKYKNTDGVEKTIMEFDFIEYVASAEKEKKKPANVENEPKKMQILEDYKKFK